MTWLIFVIITVITDSARIFIDNYVSDTYFKGHHSVSQKLFYGYAFTIFSIITLIIAGFNFEIISLPHIINLLISGAIGAISGIFYYRALELDDSTNLGIFIQLAPVFYLILGWLFLGESFSPFQLVAFAIIIAAPLLIVLTTRKKSRSVRIKAVIYSLIYVFIAVVGNLVFVKTNASTSANFFITTALVLLGKGIANIVIVYANPKWCHRFRYVLKRSRGKVLRPMLTNFIFGGVKEFTYRAALAFAPAVALASAASDSAEPIVIFFMGVILTLIWPRFGREKLDKKSVLVHLAATALVVVGIVLLQF